MEINDVTLALEFRIRSLGFQDPLWIADTIRIVTRDIQDPSLEIAMDHFDLFMEEFWEDSLGLSTEEFPDLRYEGIFMRNLQNLENFSEIAIKLKEQFSSRGKGFGKMVPRPIDFAGFAKLTDDKIDKKTLIYTSIFWMLLYTIIIYFILF